MVVRLVARFSLALSRSSAIRRRCPSHRHNHRPSRSVIVLNTFLPDFSGIKLMDFDLYADREPTIESPERGNEMEICEFAPINGIGWRQHPAPRWPVEYTLGLLTSSDNGTDRATDERPAQKWKIIFTNHTRKYVKMCSRNGTNERG